jgi:hypothetical protein
LLYGLLGDHGWPVKVSNGRLWRMFVEMKISGFRKCFLF